jgi:hypothetical protein
MPSRTAIAAFARTKLSELSSQLSELAGMARGTLAVLRDVPRSQISDPGTIDADSASIGFSNCAALCSNTFAEG